MLKFLTLFFTVILLTFTSLAQVINVEKKRKENKDGWQGLIALSLGFDKNTKEILQAKNNIALQYNKKAHTVLIFNDIDLMLVDSSKIINSGFQHLRYNYTLFDSSFITFETFVQYQYNTIKLLKSRYISGLGPRFKIFENQNLNLSISTLLMYEQEELSDGKKTQTKVLKGDFYSTLSLKITEALSINNVTYYQPQLVQFTNYRISSESNLTFKIANKISLGITYELSFDSNPPTDFTQATPTTIPKLFYTLSNSIIFNF